jgi:hypothetical protein
VCGEPPIDPALSDIPSPFPGRNLLGQRWCLSGIRRSNHGVASTRRSVSALVNHLPWWDHPLVLLPRVENVFLRAGRTHAGLRVSTMSNPTS